MKPNLPTDLFLEQTAAETVRTILYRRIPDRTVWAFGSRTDGRYQQFSDLDLVVVGEEKIPDDIYRELVEDFDESDLPIRVDLLDWNRIDDDFKPSILEHYVVLT